MSTVYIMMAWPGSLFLLLALCCCVQAFYLPGLAPTSYCRKQDKDASSKSNCKVRAVWPAEVTVLMSLSSLATDEGLCARQQTGFVGDYSTL